MSKENLGAEVDYGWVAGVLKNVVENQGYSSKTICDMLDELQKADEGWCGCLPEAEALHLLLDGMLHGIGSIPHSVWHIDWEAATRIAKRLQFLQANP